MIKSEPDLLIILDQLYIDSRYPGQMGLSNGKPTLKESKQFFKLAREIIEAAKTACLQ